MKRLAIGLSIVVIILVVVMLVLYSSIGDLITKAVTTVGPEMTQSKVELNKTVIDAGSGQGSMSGLTVGNPKGFKTESAFKMEEVKLTVNTDSLTSNTIIIKEVSILAPQVTYELGGNGSNMDAIEKNIASFTQKYAGSSKTKGKSSAEADGKKIIIDHVYIKGGKVNVSATFLGGKSMTVPLPDIHLKDLGKKSNGASAGAIMQTIFGAIKSAILKAVAPLNLDKMGDAAGEVVSGVQDVVEGAGDKLKKGAEGTGDVLNNIFGK